MLLGLGPAAWGQVVPANLSLGAALESTLREHPLLHIQEKQVEYSRGALLRVQSQFDRTLSAGASYNRSYQPLDEVQRTVFETSSTTSNAVSADIAARQQFRNGVTIAPAVSVNQLSDNVGEQTGLNQSHIAFQVNVPLLRGRGRENVAAQETAGTLEVEASLLDLNATISDLLYNTAAAYWSAVAAERSLRVYEDAETRGRALLENVQALVDADRNPQADLAEVKANLADRSASRVSAAQRRLEALQQLALAMGLAGESLANIGEPDAQLPAAPAETERAIDTKRAIATAQTRRADYIALSRRRRAADALVVSARNQLRPQLDLQLNTGYSGLREGRRPDQLLISPFIGVRGIDAGAGIRYTFPQQNRAAEGTLAQAQAGASQAAYRITDSERTIESGVVVASEGLRSAVLQLARVNESVGFFRDALDNQREKYRLGAGSVVDVLTVEDRLTNVLAEQVQAQLGYALALARLRRETGLIVAPDQAVQTVDPDLFTTLPEVFREQ
jgi:outer membrane protein TolC